MAQNCSKKLSYVVKRIITQIKMGGYNCLREEGNCKVSNIKCFHYKYSGDLNNGLVEYLNGPNMSNHRMVCYSSHDLITG